MAQSGACSASEVLEGGSERGALISEKTGTAFPIEVITAEGDRVLAIVQCGEGTLKLLNPQAKVRIEIPREGAVAWIQGRVRDCQPDCDGELVEVDIACEAAEVRQRRMDVRIEETCLLRDVETGRGDEMAVRALSVSADGGLIVSDCLAKVGGSVEAEFSLGGQHFCTLARVERRGVKVNGAISRTNAALKLLNLNSDQLEKLRLFVLAEQARNAKSSRRR